MTQRYLVILLREVNRFSPEQGSLKADIGGNKEHGDGEKCEYDPYAFIEYYFETGTGIALAREDLEDWFKAAFSSTYAWSKGSPSDLLYIYDQILLLMKAAFEILSFEGKEERRTLELTDPLLALKEVFKFMDPADWKKELHTWLHAGLGKQSIVEMVEPENLLFVCQNLRKLLETCFVINLQKQKTDEQ